MQAIQLAAGDAFRDVGMSSVAEGPPLPAESLSGYREAGRAWVAVDDHDDPVGFVVADVIDGPCTSGRSAFTRRTPASASARCSSIMWPAGPPAGACRR